MEAVTAGGGASLPAAVVPPATDAVPVFVMLPLDTVNADGVFKYAASRWFLAALEQLKESGIHGVAVDVWVSTSPFFAVVASFFTIFLHQ